MRTRDILGVVVLLLGGCQSVPAPALNLTVCQEARPDVCTMIFSPVCALEKDGSFTTYSSDCTACSHAGIVSYQQGMCAEADN